MKRWSLGSSASSKLPGQDFDLPLDVRGTAFQHRVWRALQDIPVGQTVSYAEIAQPDRFAQGGSRSGRCLRGEQPRGGDPMSSGGPEGWLALRLRLGRGTQARADREGGAAVNFARVVRTSSTAGDADLRVSQHDWTVLSEDLNGYGCAVIEKLLSPEDCQQIAELYPEEGHFRSHILMARHGFGKGEYR